MKKHRIVFIGYWSISDGLTSATIFPWLKTMQMSDEVEQVIFCTIERDKKLVKQFELPKELAKVLHHPLYPLNTKLSLVTKISDFIQFPKAITALVQNFKATVLFAHGAPAGALAYKVWKKINIPFYVSLFEPHAAYMLESGTWSKLGMKYNFQKYWEKQQIKYANGIMPVARGYTDLLLYQGALQDKLRTVPCSVEFEEFQFDSKSRKKIRTELSWINNTVGIYVGKYGDLYYDDEAFQIYKQCFDQIPDFKLIILSPQPSGKIFQKLYEHNIDVSNVWVGAISHQEVPKYLSAADFAFATYKHSSSKRYLSPVKVGEYWANGLPVLLTEGIGDDSDIIKKEGGGALFSLTVADSVERALVQMVSILQDPMHRQEIPALARKYRSPERIKEAYEYFFGKEQEGQG
jgi:glycosyltransferase involved in cell wall biosynthesis